MAIDTGAGNTYIPLASVVKMGLRAKKITNLPTFEGIVKIGVVQLSRLSLGPLGISDLMVGYPLESNAPLLPTLGLDIPSRFRITIDVEGKKMYLSLLEKKKP